MKKIIEYHRNELERYSKMGDGYHFLWKKHVDYLNEIEEWRKKNRVSIACLFR
jgi:hypothetical protein